MKCRAVLMWNPSDEYWHSGHNRLAIVAATTCRGIFLASLPIVYLCVVSPKGWQCDRYWQIAIDRVPVLGHRKTEKDDEASCSISKPKTRFS